MEAPFKCDVGIPNEYYRMIGIIAALWERLDFVLELAVAEVGMHNPFEVGLLTLNLTFTAKIELILVYAEPLKKKAPDEWTKFHDVIQEIRRVNKLRNEYVHARWFVDPTQTELPLRSIARTYQGKLE